MKVFLQQNWFKIGLLIVIVIVITGVFYWFQWRPAQIRHDCSWVKKHSDAIPAKPAYGGKTQKEIDECKAQAILEAEKVNSEYIRMYPVGYSCELRSTPVPAEPAQPAKDWQEKASKTEYDFCIHEKGL